MQGILIVIHVLISIMLTVSILLQSSKGGGLAGTFGGSGAMGAVFGGRGAATFLSKLTTGLAIAFMVIALLLGFLTRSNVDQSSLVAQERDRRIASQSGTLPQITQEGQMAPAALPAEPQGTATNDQTDQATPEEE